MYAVLYISPIIRILREVHQTFHCYLEGGTRAHQHRRLDL